MNETGPYDPLPARVAGLDAVYLCRRLVQMQRYASADRLAKSLASPLDHLPAWGEQRPHAESLADRLRSSEPSRDLELLLDQLTGPIVLAKPGRGKRRVAAPHQRHRVRVGDHKRSPAGVLEIVQGGARIA